MFTLTHPTKDGVQTITLPEKTTGRTVSLLLPGKKEMSFREVEVYNGPLLGKYYNGKKEKRIILGNQGGDRLHFVPRDERPYPRFDIPVHIWAEVLAKHLQLKPSGTETLPAIFYT